MTRTLLIAALLVLTALPAAAQESEAPGQTVRLGEAAGGQLFPAGLRPDDAIADAFYNDWWSRQLAAMGEGALFTRTGENAEVYRMMFLPTWGPARAIRIERSEDRAYAVVKALDGLAGFETGSLVSSERFELSTEDWDRLSRLRAASGFFEAPTFGPRHGLGRDGHSWVIEGVRDGRYHVITRRALGGADLGLWLSDMADLMRPEREPALDFVADPGPRRWRDLSRLLRLMEEPPLRPEDAGGAAESVRLISLAHGERPLSIGVQHNGERARVTVKEVSGDEWHSDRRLVVDVAAYLESIPADQSAFDERASEVTASAGRVLATSEWEALKAAWGASGFWDIARPFETYPDDGDVWILEARMAEDYGVVLLRPSKGVPARFVEVSQFLLGWGADLR